MLGLFAISGFWNKQHRSAVSLRNIFPALMVGLCITGYVMTDKMVLQSLSPLSIIELSNMAYVIVLSPAVLRSKQIKEEWRVNKHISSHYGGRYHDRDLGKSIIRTYEER